MPKFLKASCAKTFGKVFFLIANYQLSIENIVVPLRLEIH
ncbi:hypothetical protein CAPSP0001_0901 [Capnocytophaga sputigena ATCC 33612]|nr:hypothetical protein CAPSP0001_0901 [Capnocytophaga sputigena ATCC 33612]